MWYFNIYWVIFFFFFSQKILEEIVNADAGAPFSPKHYRKVCAINTACMTKLLKIILYFTLANYYIVWIIVINFFSASLLIVVKKPLFLMLLVNSFLKLLLWLVSVCAKHQRTSIFLTVIMLCLPLSSLWLMTWR